MCLLWQKINMNFLCVLGVSARYTGFSLNPMPKLPILFLDDHLVAVNKPSGLLVHRSEIDRRETENAMRLVRNQLRTWVYPFHRLDRATSGVLVFALDPETARRMTELFTEDAISKHYLAIVRGHTKEEELIDYPLKEQKDGRTVREADTDKPAQRAITRYRRLATVELPEPVGRYATARYSLLHVKPLTGRTHQIRRHLKHIFHPVVGDTTHGDGKHNDFFRTQFNSRRLLLHADAIEFVHPYTRHAIRIQAPRDDTFTMLLKALGWDPYLRPGG